MLKPIINVPPWAANDPDLKTESSILFYSLLKKCSFLKRETNHRTLVRFLKAQVLRFLCARVEEYPYSDAVDGGAVKGRAAGKEQGMLCLLSPHFLKRCPSSPQSVYPLEDVHSITRMTDKKLRCLVCDCSLFCLMSKNRSVASSELDPCVHRDTAQSLLISCN